MSENKSLNGVDSARLSDPARPTQNEDQAASLSPDVRAAHTAGSGAEGAPPSNTAPYTCIDSNEDRQLPYFQALRWGVDSLYVSYKGSLTDEAKIQLKRLKELAQSQRPSDVAVAQIKIGDHIFEVKDKGTGLFGFILEDNAYRIQLAKPGSKLPMAYVKVSSQYLTARTPWEIVEELDYLLSTISSKLEEPKVSRIDLFVDFVSSINMESWDRTAWVTRANQINAYSVAGQFSGWTVGLGGAIAARLYDKVLEIVSQSKKDYLFPLWQKAGWSGSGRVWRLEFEFKQEAISQLGIKDFDLVMEGLGGLWGYATTEWLRLTEPNPSDATRSRWPIHPLWALLASIDWEDEGGPLTRTFPVSREPSHDWLMTHGLSSLTSFMASQGVYDFAEGLALFREELHAYHEEKAFLFGQSFSEYVWDKVALKIRQYNRAMNADQLSEAEKQSKRMHAVADAYRKASDGE
ncbi:hypothetical protein ACIPEN_20705 [Herbaspirillum chlorophenolicum]|uniref:Replication initiation factor n=1 Tax=Herbaspirillum chlorophenolicum TaxID=211589 RepID=A0ABW8F4R2_9BURK